MVKKGHIEINLDITDINVQALPINAILLKPGLWKNYFTDPQNKLMIAEALNYCAYNKDLHIAGYLITSSQLYLVLRAKKADIGRMLAMFYDALRKIIKQHQEHLKNRPVSRYDMPGKSIEGFTGLFSEHTLFNHKLIQLLIGQPVNETFHDPYFTRLQKSLHHYNFCSVIDYSGARGPVRVSKG